MRRHRSRKRELRFIDEVEVCGVLMRRITLPNGKRVFEEECVRALLLETQTAPGHDDFVRFEEFTRPPVQH